MLAAGVDYEIRTMLVGQKPPGQNPNYLDFTRPPVTDRFKDALLAASTRITEQRRLAPKLAILRTHTEHAQARPKTASLLGKSGEPCRTRTYNLEIKSLLLYQLS